tara:strand:- start:10069 stop:10464 length:396 start_codon:yes stop_codon:yes gene_type:complete
MNDYENGVLTDFKVYCPKYIIQKYKHKHQNAEQWTRFYYYKDKKRLCVPPQNMDYDYEVSSTLAYNKNVFYKMTTMSNSDTFFDYYFKLKSDLPKVVVKSSNRKSQRLKSLKVPEEPRELTKDGKFIVRFQ